MKVIFTIGHSTHTLARFIALLKMHSIAAICDVRSQPFSRINHQFNREELHRELKNAGIEYIFLGKELGARSEDPNCYIDGKVQYKRLAKTKLFQEGIETLLEKMKSFRIALMCAEKEPLACHRTILVARQLQDRGVKIEHILETGNLENQETSERRLLRQFSIQEADLFRNPKELIAEAYEIQGQKIAYREQTTDGHNL